MSTASPPASTAGLLGSSTKLSYRPTRFGRKGETDLCVSALFSVFRISLLPLPEDF
jgi:hypothetical protein